MGRLDSFKNLFSRRIGTVEKVLEVDSSTRARIIRLFALTYPNQGFVGQNELEHRCRYLHEKMLIAYGKHELSPRKTASFVEDYLGYIQNCETQQFLDWLEMITELEDRSIVAREHPMWNDHRLPELADDINDAMELEGCQYRLTKFEHSGGKPKITRVDEPLIYELAVAPALNVLEGSGYEEARNALVKALEHQRRGQNDDTTRESGNALESVCRRLYRQLPNYDLKISEGNLSNIIAELLTAYQLGTGLTQPILQIASIRNSHSNAHPRRDSSPELAAYAIGTCCSAITLLVSTAKMRNLA